MPRKPRYAKIAITIPEEDLRAADRLAKQQDRPRSWIIAEAVRQYAAGAAPRSRVEPLQPRGENIGEYRRAQLTADLQLTPEERVRAAEDTARIAFVLRPPLGRRVLQFDHYEDYLEWRRRGDA